MKRKKNRFFSFSYIKIKIYINSNQKFKKNNTKE